MILEEVFLSKEIDLFTIINQKNLDKYILLFIQLKLSLIPFKAIQFNMSKFFVLN